MNQIYFGDNLKILREMPNDLVDLIYIDPPFNTKKTQKRTTIQSLTVPVWFSSGRTPFLG